MFVLGLSHHVYLEGCALTKMKELETPLGNLTVCKKTVAELHKSGACAQLVTEVNAFHN